MPKVFEPFIQDKHAVGFNGEGLGIGLTVVRDLVRAHGATWPRAAQAPASAASSW